MSWEGVLLPTELLMDGGELEITQQTMATINRSHSKHDERLLLN